MSAFEAPAFDAIAFQLVAALERYQLDAASVVDSWLDLGLYETCGKGMDEVQRYASSFPQLRAAAVELLIVHAELVQALWRRQQAIDPGDQVKDVLVHHAACVQVMRGRALRYLHRTNAKA